MISIEKALEIALAAHKGQRDIEGKPVILHPLKVGLMGETREEIITGFLHDVVEDTSYTFTDLLREGVDEEIIDALILLTHEESNMSYDEYIAKIAASGNRLALKVKLNDITHNLERGRAFGHKRLVAKHEKAYDVIRNAMQKNGKIQDV